MDEPLQQPNEGDARAGRGLQNPLAEDVEPSIIDRHTRDNVPNCGGEWEDQHNQIGKVPQSDPTNELAELTHKPA